MLYLFPTAVSLCACRHSNEEYCFYTTFDRITSGEVPIRGSMFQNGTNFFGFCFLPSLKTKPSYIEMTVRTNEPISNLSSVTLRRLSR